ncbi:HYC_CC_PP family protein [Arachidicoccus terrestris]|uniref:HYC_CC_PP family protein n=1 Tax=Arachidicoccus terrestris TaxID=2875539 RepID=UPI001CC5A1B4|nr:hypothetical protein [Arachidicoccus terrestris]UAY55385.1 hypothetical protein K9M52_18590 [Arachidicoccus terrestris]
MKKVFAVILSFVYFVAIGGVGMNLHYCCGVLDHAEFSYAGTSTAGNNSCGMESSFMGKNCCKNVHKQLKIERAQQNASNIAVPAAYSFIAILPDFPEPTPLSFDVGEAKSSFLAHGPPLPNNIPVYLKNCSFLI